MTSMLLREFAHLELVTDDPEQPDPLEAVLEFREKVRERLK